jgi:hypothetical protein
MSNTPKDSPLPQETTDTQSLETPKPTAEAAVSKGRSAPTTDTDLLFARSYFKSHNAARSYAEVFNVSNRDTAAANGHRKLMNDKVQTELARLGEIANNRGILTREKVEREIARVAFGNLADLSGEEIESIDDLARVSEDVSAMVKKVKRTSRYDKEGDLMSTTIEIEGHDKGGMLSLAANTLGMTKNQEQVGVTVIFQDSTDLEIVDIATSHAELPEDLE